MGTNGRQLRIARNAGDQPLDLLVTTKVGFPGTNRRLVPGEQWLTKADLMQVSVPRATLKS